MDIFCCSKMYFQEVVHRLCGFIEEYSNKLGIIDLYNNKYNGGLTQLMKDYLTVYHIDCHSEAFLKYLTPESFDGRADLLIKQYGKLKDDFRNGPDDKKTLDLLSSTIIRFRDEAVYSLKEQIKNVASETKPIEEGIKKFKENNEGLGSLIKSAVIHNKGKKLSVDELAALDFLEHAINNDRLEYAKRALSFLPFKNEKQLFNATKNTLTKENKRIIKERLGFC